MFRMRATFERAEHPSTIITKLLPEPDLARVIAGDRHRLDRAEERDARGIGRRGSALCREWRQHRGQLCSTGAGDILAHAVAAAIVQPGQPTNEFITRLGIDGREDMIDEP